MSQELANHSTRPLPLGALYRFAKSMVPVAVIGWTARGEPVVVDFEGDVRVVERHRVRVLTRYDAANIRDAREQAEMEARSARATA